jgi:hypothetical protein
MFEVQKAIKCPVITKIVLRFLEGLQVSQVCPSVKNFFEDEDKHGILV